MKLIITNLANGLAAHNAFLVRLEDPQLDETYHSVFLDAAVALAAAIGH